MFRREIKLDSGDIALVVVDKTGVHVRCASTPNVRYADMESSEVEELIEALDTALLYVPAGAERSK